MKTLFILTDIDFNTRLFIGIVLIGIVFLFLILRVLNLWYWKIDERIDLQKETNRLLNEIIQKPNKDNSDKEVNVNK